jgi:D-glycero-alpha-D-manno-heptose-7-phosphate kinase
VPFEFESAGSQIIFYEPGVNYEEAERARDRATVRFRELRADLAEAS